MVSRPNIKRILIVFVIMALFLAACGGSTETSSEADGEQRSADGLVTAEVDQTDEMSDEVDTPPDDLALVDEAAANDAAAETFTGDPDSPWCAEMRVVGADSSPFAMEIFGLSPADMEARFSETEETFNRMDAIAPPEIEQDMRDASKVVETFITLGSEAGWDLDQMLADPAFAASFDLLGLESAISQIERYTLDVCGLDLD